MLAPQIPIRHNPDLIDTIEVLSALCDPERLEIYLHIKQAGRLGLSIEALCQELNFVPCRILPLLRWLQRAKIVTLYLRGKTEMIKVNVNQLQKFKEDILV